MELAWPSSTLASLILIFLQPSLDSSFRKKILKVSEECELLQHIFWMASTPPRATGLLVQPQHNDFMSLIFFYSHRVPWGHSPDSNGVSGGCARVRKTMEWMSYLWGRQRWKQDSLSHPWWSNADCTLWTTRGRESNHSSICKALFCSWGIPAFCIKHWMGLILLLTM